MRRLTINRLVFGLAALAFVCAPVSAQQVRQTGRLNVPVVLCQSAVQVSHTGNTNETELGSCTIPANAMGPNGRIRVSAQFSYTSSVNSKTLRVRFGGIGGTVYVTISPTSTLQFQAIASIANRNATNSQAGGVATIGAAGSVAVVTSAVDTTASTTVSITGQLTNTGETVALESSLVELIRGN